MSAFRPRKPSVAASRRFSCASLALSGGRRPKDHGPENARPKVFLNGRNVTPLPLGDAPDSSSTWTIEDVGFLRPGADDGTRIPKGAKKPLAWPEPRTDAPPQDRSELNASSLLQSERCGTTPTRNKAASRGGRVGSRKENRKELRSRPGSSARKKLSADDDDDDLPRGSFVITLEETPTEALLRIPGSAVANDAPDYMAVRERNAALEESAESRKTERHTGRFRERAAQTFHGSQRTRASTASSPECRDIGVGCSPHDTREVEGDSVEEYDFVGPFTAAMVARKGCLLDVSDGSSPCGPANNPNSQVSTSEPESIQDVLDTWSKASIMNSPALAAAARTIELAIQQTCNVTTQLRYLGIPKGTDMSGQEEAAGGAADAHELDKLFSFVSPVSDERTVNSVCWHKSNHHNLAVGYGSDSCSAEVSGMIMFWSLRNTDHPEMVISTSSEVRALDYSATKPTLIAAGLFDGRVLIYDTSRKSDRIGTPVAESTFLHGRHMLPVWKVKWVVNQGRYERLISCSSDGRILQWSYQKGLSLAPLMTMRRNGCTNSAISRIAAGEIDLEFLHPTSHQTFDLTLRFGSFSHGSFSGLCFSFPNPGATDYLVGTEDGDLYKCSTSYNEQHLGIFQERHAGPVLQIKHSPFLNDVFLTCSSDWTVKLWSTTSQEDCRLHFEFSSVNLRSAVNDIAWSPTVSTMFALAADDGRVQLWDFSHSALDPLVMMKPTASDGSNNIKRTTCLFSPDGSALLTGSSSGRVDVYLLKPQYTEAMLLSDCEDQADKLKNILFSSKE